MIKKTRIAAAFLPVALAALAAAGQSQSAQDKGADKAQIVSIAEILKVDAKKMTLDVRSLAPASSTDRGASRPSSAPGGGRRQGGQGGIGFPGAGGNGGGRPYPGRNPSVVTNQPKEFKIFVTSDTVLKLFNTTIEFSDLHVSDRIAVSGLPKGKNGDLEATTITRDPPQ